ncbi:MAG: MoxR family ATPase [Planctomycetota bacterium]|nr:MAG: MoxR family ATPase [Planctomycetota bacterium]
MDVKQIGAKVEQEAGVFEDLTARIGKVIVGQRELVETLLLALLADGHVLLEGLPGLAKTLSVSCLAALVRAQFRRIQFTPDLLPADLLGTLVYSPRDGSFTTRRGPIFANLVLADEINRAPAKVQSALLEAMQERQVTLGDASHPLPAPFLVLATQNPIEQEGTYPLPEAQVDRFLFKCVVRYPSKEEERQILERASGGSVKGPEDLEPLLKPEDLLRARELVREIYVDDKLKDYIVDLVQATRQPADYGLPLAGLIDFGSSPRGTVGLLHASRAQAFLRGRGYVTPQDVKDVAPRVLRHRLLLSYEAEAEEKSADDVVRTVLDGVRVP